ncbi:MAG TPA: hypothetical protein PKN36_05185 [bacterium]|nr:hypothetical protein [bacterium]
MDIAEIYRELKDKYGRPGGQWSLWCKRPKTSVEKETVVIEAILTQRANWKNVVMAVENLRKAGYLCLEKIVSCRHDELESMVRPSGFYRIKAERLKILAGFILNECGGMEKAGQINTTRLREGLLSLKGVGEETADDILLYAFERAVFVIDEYTKRLARNRNLAGNFSYGHLQKLFEKELDRKDYALYQDFHALIVIDGKNRQEKNDKKRRCHLYP